MITIGLHFECGWGATLITEDYYTPAFYLLRVDRSSGESIDLFFPTRETRDAVRDALLKCPGCVARPEVEAEGAIPDQVPIAPPGISLPVVANLSQGGREVILGTGKDIPQPAVQAMDATEDWF